MVVQVSNVNFGGMGANLSLIQFCQDDLEVFKGRSQNLTNLTYVEAGTYVNVYYHGDSTVAIIGIESTTGRLMSQSSDWLVLPCPPYCHRVGGCSPNESLSLGEAIALLPSLSPAQ